MAPPPHQHLLLSTLLLAAPRSASASVASVASAAPEAFYWSLKSATNAHGSVLNYEERALALAFQGIVNVDGDPPTLFMDAGALDFDWSAADEYWHDMLEKDGRVHFKPVQPTLCALLEGADPSHRVKGLVGYPSSDGDYGDGYSLAIALTVAGQRQLLPVDAATLANNPCLAQRYTMEMDLRTNPAVKAGRASAWAWAYEHLLPSSSKTTVYNLWRYRQHPDPDPQRNATAATIDYAVQKNAFVLDHQTHLDTGGGPGMASCSQDLEAHPQADCSPGGISPWLNASEDACHRIGCCWHAHGLQPTGHMCVHPSYNSTTGCCAGPDLSEDHFVASVLATMEPLFSAYGWSYEYSWTNLTSIAGGAVFCSFATPNLSFWSLMPLPTAQSQATGKPRKLPTADNHHKLNRSKYYVTFVTNEGDTPRIVDSLFGAAWADPRRGSVPVAWAIDPVLGDQFPALWDYYASTAAANDSFVAGVGGGGYVFLNTLSPDQFQHYAQRVGRLLHDYGPGVVDTYGFADPDLLLNYSAEAAKGGVAPSAYISEPTHWGFWDDIPGKPIEPYTCTPHDNTLLSDGKTPMICTPGTDPFVFYFAGGLNKTCPSCDFAERIRKHAEAHPPPYFITTYGALHWTANAQAPLLEFWTLLNDTMAALGEDFVAVGADEMARLAAEALRTCTTC